VAHEGRDVVLMGADVTEEYILQRYDGVIHMVTAADGAAAFYRHRETEDDQGNIVFRRETAEQAVEQDRRTQECWASHPHLIVVRNPQVDDASGVELSSGAQELANNGRGAQGAFDRKLAVVTESVLAIARQAHPL
jgi:hypothetical protein